MKITLAEPENALDFTHNEDRDDMLAEPRWAVGCVYDINGVAYRLVTGSLLEGTITFELVEDVDG